MLRVLFLQLCLTAFLDFTQFLSDCILHMYTSLPAQIIRTDGSLRKALLFQRNDIVIEQVIVLK